MWIVYSLLTALFNSLKSVSSKKSLRSLDKYVVSWFVHFLPFVFIMPLAFAVGFPELGEDFWPVFVLDCCLSAVATVLSIKALMRCDLSVTVPMSAFTPLFLLFTSYLILGEIPSAGGFIGVIMVVVGAYFLNISERKNGWKAPFKALIKEEGPKLMLAAAFIWSITGNLDKIAVQNSSPIFFSMSENFLIALLITPFALGKIRKQKREIAKEKIHIAAIGIFSALMVIFQMIAIQEALVVYVLAIKRVSILISIILGGLIFKEKGIKQRFIGGAIMVLGVLFITLL